MLIKETALIELRGAPGRVLTDNYLINLFQETRASTGLLQRFGVFYFPLSFNSCFVPSCDILSGLGSKNDFCRN